MRQIGAVFYGFVASMLRDKGTIFWDLVFPIMLLVILISIFGNMGESVPEVVFDVGLVVDESASPGVPVGSIVQNSFLEMAGEEASWLTLFVGTDLAGELDALERGERHVVLHISGSEVQVYIPSGRFMSEVAGDVLKQVLGSINMEINRQLGLVSGSSVQMVYSEVESVGDEMQGFSYAAYMVPGIILMVFLNSGFGPMIQRLAIDRERGILRRLFASPLGKGQYFAGVLLYILVLSIVQVSLIYMVGSLFYGVRLNLFSGPSLLYMFLALVTLLSVGFAISALAKTVNSAVAIANGLFYPLMFLGGLYFPVMQVPYPIKLIVLVNPVTYLVNGFRHSLGVFVSPTPQWANLVVPMAFIVVTLAVGIGKFKWEA